MGKIINKRNIIIASLIIIISVVIAHLYGTLAISNVETLEFEKVNKVFNLNIDEVDDNTYKTTISNNDSKDLNIVLKNEEGISLNYALFYSGVLNNSGITIGVLEESESKSSGVITDNSSYNIKIRVINNTNTDININIGVTYGYENGGDLLFNEGEYIIDKVITNEENLDSSGANAPEITSEMIPVYYDEYDHNWKKADETNKDKTTMWYNYQDRQWANIVLKDTNSIIDLSNNMNNGTNVGATWDKENGYITTSNSGYIDCGFDNYFFGDKISIVLRFKFNSLSNSPQELIGNWQNNTGGGISYSLIDGSYHLNGNFNFSNSAEPISVKSDANVISDTWYTVVLTYNGSNNESDNFKIYINGELTGSSSATGAIMVSDNPLRIGYNSNITVSDVLIFNNDLSEEDIMSNYNTNITNTINKNLIMYYNFMDGADIPNGTVISDNNQDGSLAFFVWIPRYKYKVWNIEKASGQYLYTDNDGNVYEAYSKGVDIIWERGTNTTGTINCSYTINNSLEGVFVDDYTNNLTTSELCTGNNGEYYTHPAFTFGGELTGFWISKFETSGTLEQPYSLPDNISLTTDSISEAFDSASIISENELYGLNKSNYTSHLIRNIEWGAVAYLTHSIYGLCDEYSCNDLYINNSTDSYTGRSSGNDLNSGEISSSKYGSYSYEGYIINEETGEINTNLKTNAIASTTGNIYGIYDLAGGNSEYVMSVLAGMYGTITSPLDPKYFDIYSYGIEYNTQISYNRSILGDAIGEVVLTESIDNGLWYNHYNYFINSFSDLLTRGGQASNIENSGQFSFAAVSSSTTETYGYRIVIS